MLQNLSMFKSIGVVIVLMYLSSLFSQTFSAVDDALTASFKALETVAVSSQKQFVK